MAIEREWGKDPGWLDGLPRERQAWLMGEWMDRHRG